MTVTNVRPTLLFKLRAKMGVGIYNIRQLNMITFYPKCSKIELNEMSTRKTLAKIHYMSN